ncbi:MAG: hypothetical protein AB7E81_18355 [Hyphomicrobiaceae bacterium]
MGSGKFIAGVVLVLGLLGLPMGQQALARMQQAPASRVVIDLPDGYKPARLFTGFLNEAAGASLIVVEMPGEAYEQLANGLTPEALAAKGIMKAEAGKLDRIEPYLYMRGEQMSGQGPVAKFMVAFKRHGVTALVTANVQKASIEAGTVTAADIEHMFTTATIAATAPPARDVFSLGYLGPFRPAGKILGASRAYTLDGKFEPSKAGVKRALLLVAPSLDLRPVTDAEAQAKALFKGLPGLKDTHVLNLRSIEIAGVPAIEIVGKAVDKDEGGEVSLYQVLVLPPRGGYYRLLGQVPMDDAGKLMPELSKIAQTFRIVE